MKFTEKIFTDEGWVKTTLVPSDFKKVKHLGKCSHDGDMFVAYHENGEIHIFKGTMEEEHVWTEGTDEEVEATLIKEAKNKGFENIDKLTLKDLNGKIWHKGRFECLGNKFHYFNGRLWLDDILIFKDGEWVEIVENKLTLEQRIKNLEDKIL